MLICFSMCARSIFSRRPTLDSLSFHAAQDFNAMDTDKALGDDPSGVSSSAYDFSGGKDFYNQISIYFTRQVPSP
jgi:hypothetical protein